MNTLDYQQIGKRIQKRRKEFKITQEKLAEKIELNSIKGTCETTANKNNLKKYFLRFFVCIYPSDIKKAKIGKAKRPINAQGTFKAGIAKGI